jgi:hypothetical protein
MVYDYSVNKYFSTIFLAAEIICEMLTGWELKSLNTCGTINKQTNKTARTFTYSLLAYPLTPTSIHNQTLV